MKMRAFIALVPVFTCILPGCLTFESQSFSYYIDDEKDTLRLFQNYKGIYGDGGESKPPGITLNEKEKSQLDSVLNGQRTFFFSNWILEYDKKQVVTQLESLDGSGEEEWRPGEVVALRTVFKVLIDNVRIENGPFYLEGEKLCGVQKVTVTNFSKVVEAINKAMPYIAKDMMPEGNPGEWKEPEEFRKRIDEAITVKDGILTAHWPMTEEAFEMAMKMKPDEKAALDESGIRIRHVGSVAHFALGKKETEIRTIRHPFLSSNLKYAPNAIETVREKAGIEEDYDPVAAAGEFLIPAAK